MTDHSKMRLGKKAARRDRLDRTLMLGKYLTAALPAPPASVDWSHGITDWGMMLNDKLGCCTIAACGHAVQVWTACALAKVLGVTVAEILAAYEEWDGYNPADPSTDQGGVELDVLNDWRQQGFASVELDAFAAINRLNPLIVKSAIWLFGGAYIGVELPLTAQTQDVWDVSEDSADNADSQPGSWGGHAVYLVGYDANYLTCVTWGQLKKMTWAWFEKYCSEAYALVSTDWLESTGVSPSGLDLAAMKANLAQVTA